MYRRFEDGPGPKALTTLYNNDEVALAWYIFKRKSPDLVLVEDQISAIRMSPHMDSCALLSTNLSDGKIAEIKKRGYRRIILCLDKDATSQAIMYGLKYRSVLPNLEVRGLPCDIKDMDEEQFNHFLTRLEE